ncbi:protein smf [Halorubrum halodurans]|uniref:Protein smf n=1 Tax=Halorubrum halodurans TaxID=1383851 RepID=A0A256IJ29_9EURY|nr:protein smf [Halorubrum halodurans]
MDEDTHRQLRNLDDQIASYTDRIIEAAEHGISLLTPLDAEYPESLREQHSPLKLFHCGESELLTASSISFAGSRDASSKTLEWVTDLSAGLAENGYCIVSGGAFGVDKAAHEAALEVGRDTLIVSPSGHNNPYPGAHSDLYEQVRKNGLVVSHRFPEETPERGSFIFRNRTNSASSSAIIIAAAGEDSGSMAQLEIALDQGKQVFIPASDVDAEPVTGLDMMRDHENVTAVKTVDDVLSSLDSKSGQQQLTDW